MPRILPSSADNQIVVRFCFFTLFLHPYAVVLVASFRLAEAENLVSPEHLTRAKGPVALHLALPLSANFHALADISLANFRDFDPRQAIRTHLLFDDVPYPSPFRCPFRR